MKAEEAGEVVMATPGDSAAPGGIADTLWALRRCWEGMGAPRVLSGALGVPKVSLSLLSKGVGDGSHARKTYLWPHLEDAHALLWSSCPANDPIIKRRFGRTYPAQLGCFYRGLPDPPSPGVAPSHTKRAGQLHTLCFRFLPGPARCPLIWAPAGSQGTGGSSCTGRGGVQQEV